jgi:hypothetical protein
VESEKFDALIRKLHDDGSRRGAVRAGLGALAASVLAALGSREDDTEAKGGKKKKKKKRKRNKGVATAICSGARPITCGSGCCPSNLPKCCQDFFFAGSPDTCNASNSNCCPNGFGSCQGEFNKCCPPTTQRPFGTCTDALGTCCPSSLGGGSCDSDEPVCCIEDPADPFSGYCCNSGETCCQKDTDCDAGEDCLGGCCVSILREAPGSARRDRTPQSRNERFVHLAG